MKDINLMPKLVRQLASQDATVVIAAVNGLAQRTADLDLQADLIDLVAHSLLPDADPEDNAPLWSMVVLGQMGCLSAVPTLLTVLDTGWDLWMEAAAEALEDIARRHGDVIFSELEAHVLARMEHDPAHGRLYIYSAIAAIPNSDQAKRFLLQQYEADELWSDAIAGDLIKLHDPTVLPVLRRGITLARAFGDLHTEIESLEAYCLIDGMPDPLATAELRITETDWTKRWNYMLQRLSAPTEVNSTVQTPLPALSDAPMDFSKLFSPDDPFVQAMQAKDAARSAWPLRDFCLQDYLVLRPRSNLEQEMEVALVSVGLSSAWTVEKLQLLMNASRLPSETMDILVEDFEFPSTEAFQLFGEVFMQLWNSTPREEFQGLTPAEKRQSMELMPAEPIVSQKVGRNDPCLCGSGKKYKRCHGS